MTKPDACRFCSLGCHEKTATYKQNVLGFARDGVFTTRELDEELNSATLGRLKCVVVSEMPSRDEVNAGVAMSGNYGYAKWKRYFEPAGWQASEVGFSHLTRCYKWNPIENKPGLTGAVARDAYKKCRTYDVVLNSFRPDCAVVSQSPNDTIQTPALYRLIVADLRKARQLVDKGYRPVVLLGDAPTTHYLPSLNGFKKWAGSWFSL